MPFELRGPGHRFGRQLPRKNAVSPYSAGTNALTPGWGEAWLALVRRWALWLVLLEMLLMLSSTVRRSLLSLLAVSTVGTLGFSAAATLDVASDGLGAGDDAVGACTEDDVDVSWVTAYELTPLQGFKVSNVELSAPAACHGDDVQIVLLADGPNLLWTSDVAELTSPAPGSDPAVKSFTVDANDGTFNGVTAVAAEAVTGVSVVITGPANSAP